MSVVGKARKQPGLHCGFPKALGTGGCGETGISSKSVKEADPFPTGERSLLHFGKNLKVCSPERVKYRVSELEDRMNN